MLLSDQPLTRLCTRVQIYEDKKTAYDLANRAVEPPGGGQGAASSNAGYWIQLAVHVFHKIIIGFQLKWKKRIWIPTETRQHSWIPKATPNRRLDSKSKRRLHQDACWIPTKLLVLDWIPNLPHSSSFRCLDSKEDSKGNSQPQVGFQIQTSAQLDFKSTSQLQVGFQIQTSPASRCLLDSNEVTSS